MTALRDRLNKSHHYALVMVDQQLLLLTSNTHRLCACACVCVCMCAHVCVYLSVYLSVFHTVCVHVCVKRIMCLKAPFDFYITIA